MPPEVTPKSPQVDSIDWLLHDPRFVDLPKIRIKSRSEILWLSAAVAGCVFLTALALQWAVYDRIFHEYGVRVVGSTIAAFLAAILTERLETASRARSLQELRRLQMLAVINHHVRNALQAILYSPKFSESAEIQAAVDRIEWTLREVLPQVHEVNGVAEPERQRARSA